MEAKVNIIKGRTSGEKSVHIAHLYKMSMSIIATHVIYVQQNGIIYTYLWKVQKCRDEGI